MNGQKWIKLTLKQKKYSEIFGSINKMSYFCTKNNRIKPNKYEKAFLNIMVAMLKIEIVVSRCTCVEKRW